MSEQIYWRRASGHFQKTHVSHVARRIPCEGRSFSHLWGRPQELENSPPKSESFLTGADVKKISQSRCFAWEVSKQKQTNITRELWESLWEMEYRGISWNVTELSVSRCNPDLVAESTISTISRCNLELVVESMTSRSVCVVVTGTP